MVYYLHNVTSSLAEVTTGWDQEASAFGDISLLTGGVWNPFGEQFINRDKQSYHDFANYVSPTFPLHTSVSLLWFIQNFTQVYL